MGEVLFLEEAGARVCLVDEVQVQLKCKVKKQYPPSERQEKMLCVDDLKGASLALAS